MIEVCPGGKISVRTESSMSETDFTMEPQCTQVWLTLTHVGAKCPLAGVTEVRRVGAVSGVVPSHLDHSSNYKICSLEVSNSQNGTKYN
ncbi:hypothetical protein AVEN_18344-1 [Araneus ventricosus]|uniref:Uncharacterized protein n=1 Tax=Araneus ventricosus TaxID=182803 RepID=A0A4Y2H9Q5_ARAVE|nr:hypothetical protein AVEN_18344-1 [Araneus ventricosus]